MHKLTTKKQSLHLYKPSVSDWDEMERSKQLSVIPVNFYSGCFYEKLRTISE